MWPLSEIDLLWNWWSLVSWLLTCIDLSQGPNRGLGGSQRCVTWTYISAKFAKVSYFNCTLKPLSLCSNMYSTSHFPLVIAVEFHEHFWDPAKGKQSCVEHNFLWFSVTSLCTSVVASYSTVGIVFRNTPTFCPLVTYLRPWNENLGLDIVKWCIFPIALAVGPKWEVGKNKGWSIGSQKCTCVKSSHFQTYKQRIGSCQHLVKAGILLYQEFLEMQHIKLLRHYTDFSYLLESHNGEFIRISVGHKPAGTK